MRCRAAIRCGAEWRANQKWSWAAPASRLAMLALGAALLMLPLVAKVGYRQAKPEGMMTWGLHFSIAPTFFEPMERPTMIAVAYVKTLQGVILAISGALSTAAARLENYVVSWGEFAYRSTLTLTTCFTNRCASSTRRAARNDSTNCNAWSMSASCSFPSTRALGALVSAHASQSQRWA